MNDAWRKMMCLHSETTEPDKEGYAICLACEGVIVARLTLHILNKAMEDVLRYGR